MRRRSRADRSGRLSRSAVIMRIWRLISASHWSVDIVSSQAISSGVKLWEYKPYFEVVPVPARGEVVPVLAYHPESLTGREGVGRVMGSPSAW